MSFLTSLGDYLPIFNQNNNGNDNNTIKSDNINNSSNEIITSNGNTNNNNEIDDDNNSNNDISVFITNEKIFATLSDAEQYLYNYARNIGFNLRKDNAKRKLGTNEITSRKYRCSKFKSKDKSSCQVFLQLRVNNLGQTLISSCNLNHNHELLNTNEILQTFQQRFIPNDIKSFVNEIIETSHDFTYSNIELLIQVNFPNIKKSWTDKDMHNYINKRKTEKPLKEASKSSEKSKEKANYFNLITICNRISLYAASDDLTYQVLLSQLQDIEKNLINNNDNNNSTFYNTFQINYQDDEDDTESESSALLLSSGQSLKKLK